MKDRHKAPHGSDTLMPSKAKSDPWTQGHERDHVQLSKNRKSITENRKGEIIVIIDRHKIKTDVCT